MTNFSGSRERVVEIGSFPMVVPARYNHATVIDRFYLNHNREFRSFDDFCDYYFTNPSTVLTARRRFRVKMLEVKPNITIPSDLVLRIIAKNGGVLVGAQGLVLAYLQGKMHLSRKGNEEARGYFSFDKKDRLPQLYDYRAVPYLLAAPNEVFCVGYGHYGETVAGNSGDVILCFCPED